MKPKWSKVYVNPALGYWEDPEKAEQRMFSKMLYETFEGNKVFGVDPSLGVYSVTVDEAMNFGEKFEAKYHAPHQPLPFQAAFAWLTEHGISLDTPWGNMHRESFAEWMLGRRITIVLDRPWKKMTGPLPPCFDGIPDKVVIFAGSNLHYPKPV